MALISGSDTSPIYITSAILADIYSILIIVFAFTGALLFSRILFLYFFRRNTGLRVKTFTRSMITYMAITVIGAEIVALWRVCFIIYSMNRYGLFKLGYALEYAPKIKVVYDWFERGYFVSIGAMPLTVFFLALERCLAVQMPVKFNKNPLLKTRMFILNLVGSPGLSIIVYLISPVNVWPFKMTVGILNTLACGFLIWKMKKTKSTTSDVIVITTIVLELCLEFFPNLLVFVIGKFPLGALFLYTSLFPLATQCLNITICGIIYNVRFSAKKGTKVVPVSTQSTTNVHNLSLAQPISIVPHKTPFNTKKSTINANNITVRRATMPFHNTKF
ncbi:hypothetical protein DdX_20104 [Ditylenchus destructor]|uniref:Uncharacterized protein n=1 Tax=Ditylenchus destructor TaxID=166010 RepID=A0AAD4MM02_9BILA|nr:hypothetical protein DdX_20104 [Ditylenchus destructor]